MFYFKLIMVSLVLVMSTTALADKSNLWFVGGAANVNVNSGENSDEYLGGELYGGYQFTPIISTELNYGYYGEHNSFGPSVILKAGLPLSDKATIKFGVGAYHDQYTLHPVGSLGVDYKLSSNWSVDFTYKVMFEAFREEDDLYALRLGATYFFTPNNSSPIVESIFQPVVEPVISDKIVTTIEVYIVKKGDFLRKIAVEHLMSYQDLLELNPNYTCCGRSPNLIYPAEQVNVPLQKEKCN